MQRCRVPTLEVWGSEWIRLEKTLLLPHRKQWLGESSMMRSWSFPFFVAPYLMSLKFKLENTMCSSSIIHLSFSPLRTKIPLDFFFQDFQWHPWEPCGTTGFSSVLFILCCVFVHFLGQNVIPCKLPWHSVFSFQGKHLGTNIANTLPPGNNQCCSLHHHGKSIWINRCVHFMSIFTAK